MPAGNSDGAVQIGEWIVNPSRDTISKGTETQKLEPRTMRLLLCLANSAGEVVSVDRLLSEVWSGVVVGSASVYQAVSQLRKILGDVVPNATYITTVPRKGYRFIAPVRPIDPPNQSVTTTEPTIVMPDVPGHVRRNRPIILGGAALAAVILMGWFIWA